MCTSASDGVADTSQGSIQSGMLSSDDTLPEYVVSENGIELTALGRHQVRYVEINMLSPVVHDP